MSRFRFGLQRVLSWRQTELSVEEAQLERLRSELQTLERQMEEINVQETREVEVLRCATALRGADLAGIARAREWLAQQKQRLQSRIADCIRSIELKTASIVEARRRVRLLERLRDRRYAVWIQEENRALDALAAESALVSWRREHGRNVV